MLVRFWSDTNEINFTDWCEQEGYEYAKVKEYTYRVGVEAAAVAQSEYGATVEHEE